MCSRWPTHKRHQFNWQPDRAEEFNKIIRRPVILRAQTRWHNNYRLAALAANGSTTYLITELNTVYLQNEDTVCLRGHLDPLLPGDRLVVQSEQQSLVFVEPGELGGFCVQQTGLAAFVSTKQTGI